MPSRAPPTTLHHSSTATSSLSTFPSSEYKILIKYHQDTMSCVDRCAQGGKKIGHGRWESLQSLVLRKSDFSAPPFAQFVGWQLSATPHTQLNCSRFAATPHCTGLSSRCVASHAKLSRGSWSSYLFPSRLLMPTMRNAAHREQLGAMRAYNKGIPAISAASPNFTTFVSLSLTENCSQTFVHPNSN